MLPSEYWHEALRRCGSEDQWRVEVYRPTTASGSTGTGTQVLKLKFHVVP
jgi:hypothetical protein